MVVSVAVSSAVDFDCGWSHGGWCLLLALKVAGTPSGLPPVRTLIDKGNDYERSKGIVMFMVFNCAFQQFHPIPPYPSSTVEEESSESCMYVCTMQPDMHPTQEFAKMNRKCRRLCRFHV